jgi:hypothetical protein
VWSLKIVVADGRLETASEDIQRRADSNDIPWVCVGG